MNYIPFGDTMWRLARFLFVVVVFLAPNVSAATAPCTAEAHDMVLVANDLGAGWGGNDRGDSGDTEGGVRAGCQTLVYKGEGNSGSRELIMQGHIFNTTEQADTAYEEKKAANDNFGQEPQPYGDESVKWGYDANSMLLIARDDARYWYIQYYKDTSLAWNPTMEEVADLAIGRDVPDPGPGGDPAAPTSPVPSAPLATALIIVLGMAALLGYRRDSTAEGPQ